jgi:hypothetical protein
MAEQMSRHDICKEQVRSVTVNQVNDRLVITPRDFHLDQNTMYM